MNEIEKIADRVEAALKKAGYYGSECFFRGKGETCPQCDEFDAILRDLRGVKVVLPQEIVSTVCKNRTLTVSESRADEFRAYINYLGHIGLGPTPSAAIAALAEKITKEKGT